MCDNQLCPTLFSPRILAWLVMALWLTGVGCERRPKPRPTVALAANQPIELFSDDGQLVREYWDVHQVRGSKVGHRWTREFETEQNGQPLRRIVSVDLFEIKRFGSISTQRLATASLETKDGQIQQWSYILKGNDLLETVTGSITDGELTLRRQRGQTTTSQRFTWPVENHGLFAISQSLVTQPMQPGERRLVQAFVPVLDRAVTVELVARDVEETTLLHGRDKLLRIDAIDKLSKGMQVPTTYWTNELGEIQKVQEGFLDRVTYRCNRSDTERANDLVQLDLGLDVGVAVDQPIVRPHESRHAVYRIELDQIPIADVFPTCATQSLVNVGDSIGILTVQVIAPTSPATMPAAQDIPGDADLQANRMIEVDDERVQAIARAATGSSDDPWQAAVALEQYLYRTLGKVDLSQVFGSAAETAARREGDCSEHAVLLAATCRARGIPARVVVGLLYSEPDQSFLYHMWNEVWITDRWIPLDATLGKGGIGAAHLKIRDSNLTHESPFSLVTPVMYLIDRLKIEVVEIQ